MSHDGETPRERAAFWAYRALERTATLLPERVGRRCFELGGLAAHRWLRERRAVVAANQARVLGRDLADPRVVAATREAFALYARYWFDAFRVRSMTRATISARTRVDDLHHIDTALAKGAGCIAVLPHTGNWDVAGCFFAMHGYPLASVAEELRPARLTALFRRHREALGMSIVPLDGGSARRLARCLAQNRLVALVGDRDLTGTGIDVAMFGAPRRLPVGPALLSLATGAPLLVGSTHTTPTGWRIQVGAPLAIERSGDLHADAHTLTRTLAVELERAIATHPPDWHVFQPAWEPPSVRATS